MTAHPPPCDLQQILRVLAKHAADAEINFRMTIIGVRQAGGIPRGHPDVNEARAGFLAARRCLVAVIATIEPHGPQVLRRTTHLIRQAWPPRQRAALENVTDDE